MGLFSSERRIWVYVGYCGVVILICVLIDEWRLIDRYFPALNKYMHGGTPTTQADLDYRLAHFLVDAKQLDNLCSSYDLSSIRSQSDALRYFRECRTQTLASKPVFEDMRAQYGQLKTVWDKELAEQSVPTNCKNAFMQFITPVDTYMSTWEQEFSLQESVNPETAKVEEIAAAMRRLQALDLEAVAALDKLKDVDAKYFSNVCKGY